MSITPPVSVVTPASVPTPRPLSCSHELPIASQDPHGRVQGHAGGVARLRDAASRRQAGVLDDRAAVHAEVSVGPG